MVTDERGGNGGLAIRASLNQPQHVALAPGGDLVFTDSYGHYVRRVNVSTGVITAVAGNGKIGDSSVYCANGNLGETQFQAEPVVWAATGTLRAFS